MNTDKKIQPVAEEMDASISPAERSLLDESIENSMSIDNNNLKRSALDTADEDGDLINETTADLTGEDLDVPGAEQDNDDENIGEEDEENNGYSIADTA